MARSKRKLSSDTAQLYNTLADIGETTNVASKRPAVVARLQAAYDAHVADIKANQRPPAESQRPADSLFSERPAGAKKKLVKKRKNSSQKQ